MRIYWRTFDKSVFEFVLVGILFDIDVSVVIDKLVDKGEDS